MMAIRLLNKRSSPFRPITNKHNTAQLAKERLPMEAICGVLKYFERLKSLDHRISLQCLRLARKVSYQKLYCKIGRGQNKPRQGDR